MAPAIRQRVVAGRMTAAWIYGCAAEPDRLALLVDANRRISSLRSVRGCTFHEVRLGPFDVVSIGGLMVSSPLRTALDVALHVEAERAVPALRALLARPELGVRLRLLRLAVDASPRVPNRKAALAKLSALAPPRAGRKPLPEKPPPEKNRSRERQVSCGGGCRWCGTRRRRRRSAARR